MRLLFTFPFLLLTILTYSSQAQDTRTDSLKAILEDLKEDTAKANILNNLAEAIWVTDPAEAITYATEAKYVSEKINYVKGLGAAYNNIGLGYSAQGNFVESVNNFNHALEYYGKLDDQSKRASILSNLGGIYLALGDENQAIKFYQEGLTISETIGDSHRTGSLLLYIGSVYSKQRTRKDSALKYFRKALNTGESTGDMELVGLAVTSLGELFYHLEEYDSSLHYFDKSLSVVSNNVDFSVSLNFMGILCAERGDFDKAIQYHLEALDMARAVNSPMETIKVLMGLASTYTLQGNPQMAIEYYEQAISHAKDIGPNEELSEAYGGLASLYSKLSDFHNAYIYSSLQNEEIISNTESTYNLTKNLVFLYKNLEREKEAEINLLEQQSTIEQLKNKRQKIISITTGSIGILLLLLVAGLFHRFLYIRRTNAKINRQKDEIEAQRDEIELQRDLLIRQKKDITDSLKYAQRIQDALLPSQTYIKSLLSEFFILFKPRDIVSGDFYWIKEIQNHLVFIGADCTGHGVPGGFMSMLGVTLLNDLVRPEILDNPEAVLGQLREKIKEMLTQEGRIEEQKDGMDMAIAILDKESRQLRFAGANNPLYLIRSNHRDTNGDLAPFLSMQNEDYKLFELKGDNQPIGVHWEENGFSNHIIDLEENDSFYIFSDGIIDQYGGEHRKKFKTANFKKLLLSIQTESMEYQKKLIEDSFTSWKGDQEQIDDVCVIGVRI